MCNFWLKKWSRSLRKFEWWSLTREFLKQYLTEKQNDCLRSGRLQEVVAYEKWSLTRSGRYERADCSNKAPFQNKSVGGRFLQFKKPISDNDQPVSPC